MFVLLAAVACAPVQRNPGATDTSQNPTSPITGAWKFLGIAALNHAGTPEPLGSMLEGANATLANDMDIQYQFLPDGTVKFHSIDLASSKEISATGTYTIAADGSTLALNITPDAMGESLVSEPDGRSHRITPLFEGDTLILRYFVDADAYADFKLVRVK
jgi:hypothetical protein